MQVGKSQEHHLKDRAEYTLPHPEMVKVNTVCAVNHTGPGGFTHLFTAMSSGIENTHQLMSHTCLANCIFTHLGCPTPSHARAHTFAPAAHTLFTRHGHTHTHSWAHAVARTVGRTLSCLITPGTHLASAHVPQAHGPRSPARSPGLSHPRVSRPCLFFWKLCSPFPSP